MLEHFPAKGYRFAGKEMLRVQQLEQIYIAKVHSTFAGFVPARFGAKRAWRLALVVTLAIGLSGCGGMSKMSDILTDKPASPQPAGCPAQPDGSNPASGCEQAPVKK